MEKVRNPLRIVFTSVILIFFLLFIPYIVIKFLLALENSGNTEHSNALSEIASTIESIAGLSWSFIKPFLQLSIILLIAEWALNKVGISLASRTNIEWNIQTIIALIIVSAFALAALSGIEGVSYLENIALVVVGFYFGSQQKKTPVGTDTENKV